jgi:hypothetical protein
MDLFPIGEDDTLVRFPAGAVNLYLRRHVGRDVEMRAALHALVLTVHKPHGPYAPSLAAQSCKEKRLTFVESDYAEMTVAGQARFPYGAVGSSDA